MRYASYIVGFLVVGLVLGGCRREGERDLSMDTIRAEGGPQQESWGASFYVSEVVRGNEASRPRLRMEADYLAEYERGDSTYTLLQGHPDSTGRRVVATLFDAVGDSSAVLRAERVYYFTADKRFEARGNVVVVTNEGRRLESEHLVWFEAERKVRTPGFVRITMPDERVQGYGLVADEDLTTYQLSRVTAEILLEEDA